MEWKSTVLGEISYGPCQMLAERVRLIRPRPRLAMPLPPAAASEVCFLSCM